MVLLNRNRLPTGGLRCRQIDEADIEAAASFLAQGFPAHDRGFWLDAFARLTKHEPPPGFPKYGYMLESDRVVVGAILLICSTLPADGAVTTRCNLSSWYVVILRRQAKWIFWWTLICTLIGTIVAFARPTRYTATAQILLDVHGLQVMQGDLTPRVDRASDALLADAESQLQVVSSGSALMSVVERESCRTIRNLVRRRPACCRYSSAAPGRKTASSKRRVFCKPGRARGGPTNPS
jgi:Chain length determinant protein